MKKRILFAIAVISATACVKENIENNVNSVFRGCIDPFTCKTYLDDSAKQHWNADDRVSIFSSTTNDEYKFDGQTGDVEGTFSKTGESEAGQELAANYAVFPYMASTSITQDGVISVEFPVEQSIGDASFGPKSNLMVAQTTSPSDRNLYFKNVCGYLLLNLYAENFTLKELRFKGNDLEPVAGNATITFDKDKKPVLEFGEETSTEIVLKSEEGLLLGNSSASATKVWTVLPAGTFEKGFTIEMIDNAGNHMTKITTKPVTIVRNEVIDMKNLDVDKCLSGEYNHISARWEMTSSITKTNESQWVNNNRLFANKEDGTGVAYISTEAGSETSSPVRLRNGNDLSAANMKEGDSFVIVYPNITATKGSTVDFMWSMYSATGNAPKYWLFEYFEDGVWKSVAEDLHTATEDASLKYSIAYYSSDAQKSNMVQSFTLAHDLKGDDLKMRLRAVGKYNTGGKTLSPVASAYLDLTNYSWSCCEIDIYQGIPVRDTQKILVLGNSFTYYQSSNFILKRLARSQGHEMRMVPFMKGGQYFRNFCTLALAQLAIKDGDYDIALLQDQSEQHAMYYTDPVNSRVLEETQDLLSQIYAASPNARAIVEGTWAFKGEKEYQGYGSMELFDMALQCGAVAVTKGAGVEMSPIGIAFQRARDAKISGLNLYSSDDKHPSRQGCYLKSCVNYCLIYGQRFDSNVIDCDVEPAIAARLRQIAEDVVFGGYDVKYFVVSDPDRTAFGTDAGSGSAKIQTNVEYTVSCPETWLTVEKDGDRVRWTVTENTDDNSRSARITLTPESMAVKTIDILQSGTKAPGGISSAMELLEFAELVNAGADYSKYLDANGHVILKADIDMTGQNAWTPAGGGQNIDDIDYNVKTAPSAEAHAFKGVFDGKGHKIKNLSLKVLDNAHTLMGFFGATDGATIRNVTFEGLDIEFKAKGISSKNIAIGGVVGYAYNTKVENVTVSVTSYGQATSTASRAVSYGGVVGIMYASAEHKAGLDYCTVNGEFTNDIGTKYSNTSTVQMGGVIGAVSQQSKLVRINFCCNNANMTVKAHKCGGIIGNAFFSEINNSDNYGNIDVNYSANKASSTTISGVRTGGIMAYCSSVTTNPSNLIGCSNYGTISSQEPSSAVGGVAGLIRCYKLTQCHNLGNVIAPDSSTGDSNYRGLLVGAITSSTDPSEFKECSLRGWIASKMDMSDKIEAGEDNYLNIGIGISMAPSVQCDSWNANNISFAIER